MTFGATAKGREIMIPNATVAQSIISSLTRQDRLYRVETSILVTYSADLAQARRTLEDTVASLEWRSRKEEPSVFLAEFTRFNVIYNVLVWIDDVEVARQRQSDLNEALWQGLEKAGIEMVSS
jgi:small-conductance mechanosensitive channel